MPPYSWRSDINYEENPHLYEIGRGQQGVLICEPYKSRILPHWKFRTPEDADISRRSIWNLFVDYLQREDFVGADMCKKYLHMGFTRSRRYANHRSGIKYDQNRKILPQEIDWATNEKAQSANLFYEYWVAARTDERYIRLKKEFIQMKKKNC